MVQTRLKCLNPLMINERIIATNRVDPLFDSAPFFVTLYRNNEGALAYQHLPFYPSKIQVLIFGIRDNPGLNARQNDNVHAARVNLHSALRERICWSSRPFRNPVDGVVVVYIFRESKVVLTPQVRPLRIYGGFGVSPLALLGNRLIIDLIALAVVKRPAGQEHPTPIASGTISIPDMVDGKKAVVLGRG